MNPIIIHNGRYYVPPRIDTVSFEFVLSYWKTLLINEPNQNTIWLNLMNTFSKRFLSILFLMCSQLIMKGLLTFSAPNKNATQNLTKDCRRETYRLWNLTRRIRIRIAWWEMDSNPYQDGSFQRVDERRWKRRTMQQNVTNTSCVSVPSTRIILVKIMPVYTFCNV